MQIEKVRFSDRLNYTINVDKSCQEYAIPPLILQTLVENSVKHGISPKPEGGEIIIEISEKHENIEIRIEDDGVGMKDEVTAGFGLDAVKNILALQYKKHSFNLINDNGVKIQITIPKMGINDEL